MFTTDGESEIFSRSSQVPRQRGLFTVFNVPKKNSTLLKLELYMKLSPSHFAQDIFAFRHISENEKDLRVMLDAVGSNSLHALCAEIVPNNIALHTPLELPEALSERDATQALLELANKNIVGRSAIGMGYFGTITPPVIKRNVLENPAWYTAYTPYQPEISQGRLEALLNYQTMISEICGYDIANASLLDEATAAAEAMAMAHRISLSESNIFYVHEDVLPQTLAVLQTRAEPIGIKLQVGNLDLTQSQEYFGGLISVPGVSGHVLHDEEIATFAANMAAHKAVSIAAVDLLYSCIATPVGQLGVDIAIGTSQRFGVPLGMGGPHAAFIATKSEFSRSLPGRLVGVSTDTEGRPALRLALQTREQHIRREKATSNICTAQVLLANIAGFYGSWHGREGLQKIALRVHSYTSVLRTALMSAGHTVTNETWFDTLTVVPRGGDAAALVSTVSKDEWFLRHTSPNEVGISIDETMTIEDLNTLAGFFGCAGEIQNLWSTEVDSCFKEIRQDLFLNHRAFTDYRTEHEMLRYLRHLADKDLALDRTMIPLGSCTMKLNATSQMEPITWPQFANIHPFAPVHTQLGSRELIDQLEKWLCSITGYDAISLQPNAGSQGEFAGLLAIRAYHQSRNEARRNICLIPSSAHGTNAASAVMAGMKVHVVKCDDEGNVDVGHLEELCIQYSHDLAALMITYPSTHGVFETAVTDICALIHTHGGQVYVDGANLNALVGLAQPGKFGADVSHLNLHKTFCIPHGGGGPGVGPVAVKSHLASFLPTVHQYNSPKTKETPLVGPVSGAPFGSAGILPIPWMYISTMGPHQLRHATERAILHANYIAKKLGDAFPVLFTGKNQRVAHECILDLRPLTKSTGVTVDDVAKRLMDLGFHAPTISFPVAGTLMVEPTESESLSEIERFCDAMLLIRQEIKDIENAFISVEDSPLRFAPHTVVDVAGEWTRQYSRSTALYPSVTGLARSYFPPVSRIDAASGDRNLVCSCAPLEQYAEAHYQSS